MLDNLTGFGRTGGMADHRLNTGSSCIGCHVDGMNRSNNNLRDWLDEGGSRLPKGKRLKPSRASRTASWSARGGSVLLAS
jgi:hypothetical protein